MNTLLSGLAILLGSLWGGFYLYAANSKAHPWIDLPAGVTILLCVVCGLFLVAIGINEILSRPTPSKRRDLDD